MSEPAPPAEFASATWCPTERLLLDWFFNLVPRLQGQGLIPEDVVLDVDRDSRDWIRQPTNAAHVMLQYLPYWFDPDGARIRFHLGNLRLRAIPDEPTLLIVTFARGYYGPDSYLLDMGYDVQAEPEQIRLVRDHVVAELIRCLNQPPLRPFAADNHALRRQSFAPSELRRRRLIRRRWRRRLRALKRQMSRRQRDSRGVKNAK